MQSSLNLEGVEQQSLKDYTEKAYLDYSMYVILDRALPQIGDGLKPEQRGLQLKANMPVYEFPPDYIARLRSAIADVDQAFGADLRALENDPVKQDP